MFVFRFSSEKNFPPFIFIEKMFLPPLGRTWLNLYVKMHTDLNAFALIADAYPNLDSAFLISQCIHGNSRELLSQMLSVSCHLSKEIYCACALNLDDNGMV